MVGSLPEQLAEGRMLVATVTAIYPERCSRASGILVATVKVEVFSSFSLHGLRVVRTTACTSFLNKEATCP